MGEPEQPVVAAVPPRKRRHLRPLYGWLVVAAVVAALAVARWAGLGPTFLDTARVESDIAEQFEARYDVGVEVDCPRRMGVAEGREHECEAVTADDEELTIVLTITDEDEVVYTWEIE
ncbi:DUF4333 domain-containing protein [Blastococcus sp. CCUG 61487]|uniref:DUF4333 domain-containing protein n=1 Tax=Blastococcus sp. CCUG 61487 TaxID=1840703 RepID=UPI0014856585|nr:DUF4333 domain-containing protein [Blastococcus sp. CCUG 61487]